MPSPPRAHDAAAAAGEEPCTSLGELRRQFASDMDAIITQRHKELWAHIEGSMARHEKMLERLAAGAGADTDPGGTYGSESFGGSMEPLSLAPPTPFKCGFLSAGRISERSITGVVSLASSNSRTSTLEFQTIEDTPYSGASWDCSGKPVRVSYTDKTRGAVERLVSRPVFDYLVSFLILVNAATVGIEVEEQDSSVGQAASVIQLVCNLVFIAELLLRLFAYRVDFYVGADWAWNVLDTGLVVFSVADMLATVIDAGGRSDFHTVRIVRIVRVLRVVRIIRVIRLMRFFRALRMLVRSIFGTLKSLVYAVMLLLLIVYCFAVIFTQASLEYDSASAPSDEISSKYGSVTRSILTLFMCISGGMNWGMAFEPLQKIHWTYTLLFMVYINFSLFAVLNVMTGQFCQSAIESAKQDEDEMICEQLKATDIYTKKLRKLFNEITAETTQDGFSLQAFEAYLADARVQAYFRSLEIEPIDAWTIFKLLDEENAKKVQLEQFITGCLKLRGVAQTIGLKELMCEFKSFTHHVAHRFDRLEHTLHRASPVAGGRFPRRDTKLEGV